MTGHACARCATPLEAGDLRCAICGFLAPARERPPTEVEALRIVRCSECGAAVAYRAEKQAPACRFCGAITQVEAPTDPLEAAAEYLPFDVTRDDAAGAMRRYLGSLGWFRPADLATRATVDSVTPVWFAGWVFDANADVTWAADSNAGSGRSAWAPHAGRARLTWKNVLVSASRGLTIAEVGRLAPAFDLGRARGVDDAVADEVERFDVERSAARARVVAAVREAAVAELERGHIPGSRFRNVHVSALLESLVTRRFALPAYVFVYRYDGRPYRAIVHGQDARVAFGAAPLAWGRIAGLVVLGVVLLGVIVAAIGSR